jgi:Leucine-rich repeat (LRR) protein
LDLCGNIIDDEGAKILSQSALTKLRLSHNQIGDKGLQALAQSKTLRCLEVEGNCYTNEGLEELCKNRLLTSLNILSFTNNCNNTIPKSLMYHPTLTALKVKILNEDDAKIIATLPGLTSLNVSYSILQKGSLEVLAGCTSLRSLNASGCTITNKDMTVLAKCRNLTSLDVSNCSLGWNEIEFLLKDLPLVRFNFDFTPNGVLEKAIKVINGKLKCGRDYCSQRKSFLSSLLSHRLPRELERIILDYCESPRFVFRGFPDEE